MSKTLPRPIWIALTFSLWLAACGGGGGSGGGTTTPPVVHSGGKVITMGIAIDANKNVYLAGYTDGGLDGNTLVGKHDMFLVTYDASGKKVRTRELGAPGGEVIVTSMSADTAGNVYIGGITDAGLDGNQLIGVRDAFLTKYDAAGNRIRTIEFGVAGKQAQISAIAVHGSDVYVAGSTTGALNGNAMTGTVDLFYSRYDSAGNLIVTRQMGASGALSGALGIAVDQAGSVYLAGVTYGDLDGNTLTGIADMCVVTFDATGTKVRTAQLGAAGARTMAVTIAVDRAGQVLVAGSTQGGLDGNALVGTYDAFLTTYDSSGTRLRTRQLGTAGKDTLVGGIGIDSHGNVYVTGTTYGNLDGNVLVGRRDAFFTQYDSNGAKVKTVQFGVAGALTTAGQIAIDGQNFLYLGGSTDGALDGNAFVGVNDGFYTIFDSSGTKVRTREFGVPVI